MILSVQNRFNTQYYCIHDITIFTIIRQFNYYLIFNIQVSPVYEVTYILECFSACVIYTVFCGICSLTAKLVSHVCGQCDILMSLFENLTETYDKDHSTIDQKISNAIIHHLRIIR